MRSPGGATDAPPAPRDASEPETRGERSPALDACGHATESPARKGTRRGKRCGAAPASAADVAETRGADAPPLGARAGADDDGATEPVKRESDTSAATAKNPVSPGAPTNAASEHTAVVEEPPEDGRSPTTPTLCFARQRLRARAVSPPTASDASADAPTSGPLEHESRSNTSGPEWSGEASAERRAGAAASRAPSASSEAPGVANAENTERPTTQTASAPAWIEPPTAPSFDAGTRPLPLASNERRETFENADDAAFSKDASPRAVANEKTFGDASSIDSNIAVHSVTIDPIDPIESPRATETRIDSESPGIPNAAVSALAYDPKRAQRLVLVPEHKVGLVLGRGGAHAAYFQHHSGAAIHVARDPGEIPGAGITIFEVPPSSSGDEDTDEEEEAEVRNKKKKTKTRKPAVDAERRRRVHLLGSETATANAAAMIARLVETSTHRLDRTSAQTARLRRERDRVATRAMLPPIGFAADASSPFGEPNVGESNATPFSETLANANDDAFASSNASPSTETKKHAAMMTCTNDASASVSSHTTVATMRVPHRRVGLIIGRRGENIRFLQDLTRAHIQVQPERDVAPGQTHRPVTLRGAADAVAEARRAIEDMCAGKTLVGSARVAPPQPFAAPRGSSALLDDKEWDAPRVPLARPLAVHPLSYDASASAYGAYHGSPSACARYAYAYAYGDQSASCGSFGRFPALPCAPAENGAGARAFGSNDAYVYYAYASPHGPYTYDPYVYDPYAYAAHFVDPTGQDFAYVPGYVPGCAAGTAPGTAPGTAAPSGTPPPSESRDTPGGVSRDVPGDVPGTLPREDFPTPGEWHRDERRARVVPAVSVIQPDVEYPGDDDAHARVPVPAPATSFRNGDGLDSRRRRPSSGERRRGGKSRRGGKGRPERGEYSGSSEYSGSARAALDATSREADEKTATARSTRASVTVKSQVETPDTTPAVTVTVSCPASPEPGVGTGGIRVDPP